MLAGTHDLDVDCDSPKIIGKELLVKAAKSHDNHQEYICGCSPPKCKHTFRCHNLISSAKFRAVNVEAIEELDEQKKKELNGRLSMETRDIKLAFYALLSSFCDSLEEQGIPIKRLRTYMMAIKAVETHSDTSALQNCSELLKSADDVDDIVGIIENHSSFFDYKLVEYMVIMCGTSSDKEKFKHYEQLFFSYLSRRVCESPSTIRPTFGDDYVDIIVKLDSRYEKRDLRGIKDLEDWLTNTLKVHTCLLNLCSVESGCIKLIFQIPCFVQEIVFPLSVEQEQSLTEVGIIQLVCGEFKYPRSPRDQQVHQSLYI